MKLWVVLRIRRDRDPLWPECEGVFDSEEAAVAICENDEFSINPCNLNEHLSDKDYWPGSYFPKAIDKKYREPSAID